MDIDKNKHSNIENDTEYNFNYTDENEPDYNSTFDTSDIDFDDKSNVTNSSFDEYCIKNVCPKQKKIKQSSIFTHPFFILLYIIISILILYFILQKTQILKRFSIQLKPSVFIPEALKIIGIIISLYLSIKGLQASEHAEKSATRANIIAEEVSRSVSRIESRNG